MPLFSHDQSVVGFLACAPSCILCVARELGVHDSPITRLSAMNTWRRTWRRDYDLSLTSLVCAEFARLGLTAEIIEDKSRTDFLRGDRTGTLERDYRGFRDDVKGVVTRHRRRGPRAFSEADFDGFARLMLLVTIVGENDGHWLLARRYRGAIHVMNPDGGTDTPEPDLIAWMNGPAVARRIGAGSYIFSGIALSVNRTPDRYGRRVGRRAEAVLQDRPL